MNHTKKVLMMISWVCILTKMLLKATHRSKGIFNIFLLSCCHQQTSKQLTVSAFKLCICHVHQLQPPTCSSLSVLLHTCILALLVSYFLLRFNVSHTTTTTTTPKPLKIIMFCPLAKGSNHAPSGEMLVAVFQLGEILVQK